MQILGLWGLGAWRGKGFRIEIRAEIPPKRGGGFAVGKHKTRGPLFITV